MSAAEAQSIFTDLFDEVVARYPDALAVVAPDRVSTYRQLAGESRRLARRLIATGIGPEDVVGVVADRDTGDWLTALLAVLYAGAAYLPIDPRYPAARIAFMLDDAAPRLILHCAVLDWVTTVPTMVIGEALTAGDDSIVTPADRQSAVGVDNLAYLIYTSGSTGTPKGVAVTHGGMRALAATQQRVVGTGPADQVLQWASPSFDAAFWDITLALLHGATLHLAAEEQLMPGDPLAETLRGRGISHATLPPVALSVLDSSGDLLHGATIVSTGDTCTQAIVDNWAPGRTLINGYGPTETTVGATLSAPLTAGVLPDVGVPFDGTRVDVVDDELNCVPTGVVGELVVGGGGIARGYHGRTRLTAERFRPDPRGAPGQRMYLTGDVGYQGDDGRLRFGGRHDDQVKLRGFRIELGEIETALAHYPGVLAAAVAVRTSPTGDDVLVAWIMSRSSPADAAAVRRYLADRLPGHMIPSVIVVVDRLPTNAHGKVDRSALTLPTESKPAASTIAHETDRRIRELFEDSLGAGVGPIDDFFDLGGNSIAFTKLIGTINREYGIRLSLREALSSANIAAVARLVADAEHLTRRNEPAQRVSTVRPQ
jgi:amino acid adenylation domain-containing protein